jgi:hypothetical protein
MTGIGDLEMKTGWHMQSLTRCFHEIERWLRVSELRPAQPPRPNASKPTRPPHRAVLPQPDRDLLAKYVIANESRRGSLGKNRVIGALHRERIFGSRAPWSPVFEFNKIRHVKVSKKF